jgi:hypothetical protein
VLEYAVAMGVIDRNPTAARIRNTRTAARREQRPFESWEQVDAISAEMDPRFAAIPVVLVGTGLRPEELNPRAKSTLMREVYRQCGYAIKSNRHLKAWLSELQSEAGPSESLDDFWFWMQSFLVAAANVSRLLWGTNPEAEARREPLRQALGVDDGSPVRVRTLRKYGRARATVVKGPTPRDMRMRGLEPPRAFAHTDLNRARLPIPPHPRGGAL